MNAQLRKDNKIRTNSIRIGLRRISQIERSELEKRISDSIKKSSNMGIFFDFNEINIFI